MNKRLKEILERKAGIGTELRSDNPLDDAAMKALKMKLESLIKRRLKFVLVMN
ncbi:MAG: hypothetical protein ACQEWW_19290 [Bacillota bacterium]